MAKVRAATVADIPATVAMGRALHAESPRYRHLSFSEEKVADLVRSMVQGTLVTEAQGGALVAEKDGQIIGMIGGYVVSPFFSHDRIASDYSLYVTPEHRRKGRAAIALVRGFEAWAIEQGAVEIWPGVSAMIDAESTVRFFEKLGYERCGSLLRKKVR